MVQQITAREIKSPSRIGGQDMKELREYKKELYEYAKTVVDLEQGESPREWVDSMIEALREDGKIIKDCAGREYVED